MRLLMTGATGFLGSHLVRAFVERGDEVHAVRRATSSLARIGTAAARVRWHDAETAPVALVGDGAFDVVLHAATHYGRGAAVDADVARVNYEWPSALMRAAGAAKVPLFVNVDTSLPPALSAYASTKRRFVDEARARSAGDGPRLLNIALESVFGPGDDRAKFQMTLLHALLDGAPSFALSPGEQTRDYIFIDDAVAGIMTLVDHSLGATDRYLAAGVGRGEGMPIRRFAEMMRALTGSETRLEFGALAYRKDELMEAHADTSLLRSLGWSGARTVEAGLRKTIERERKGA